MAYQCHYRQLSWQLSSGEEICEEVKCWIYEGGEVLWEIRRFFSMLGYTGRSFDMTLFFKRLHKSSMDAAPVTKAMDGILPSRKALRARHDAADDPHVREEWQIRTEGLFFLLSCLVQFRRGSGHDRAIDTFRVFVASYLPLAGVSELCDFQMTTEEKRSCHACDPAAALCPHAERALDMAEASASLHCKDALAVAILQLASPSSDCPACMAAHCHLLSALAAVIDRGTESFGGAADPLEMHSHTQSTSGKKRKRRYDEDFKAAVSERVVREQRAVSCRAFAKAQGSGICDKTADSWHRSHLQWYQAASWSTFTDSECLSICMDGTRLGHLTQDIFLYSAYSVELDRSVWLPPAVIPDWREEGPAAPAGEDQEVAKAAWKLKIAKHMAAEKTVAKAVARALAQIVGSKVRLSNEWYGLAFERSLRMGTSLTLQHFFVEAPRRRLEEHEERFFMPDEAEGGDEFGRRRACIQDGRTGEIRYELSRQSVGGVIFRPCLFVHCDKGAVGLPFWAWAFTKGQLRGAYVSDWVHNYTNMVKRGHRLASSWWILCETTIAFNFTSYCFFQTFKNGFMSYWEKSNEHCALFLYFYERLAADMGPQGHELGTPEHIRAVWLSLPGRQCFKSPGKRIRLGRWWSWHDRRSQIDSDWTVIAFALVVVGVGKGWRPSLQKSPYEKRSALAPNAQDLVGDENELPKSMGQEPTTVKDSNALVDKRRMNASNTMHFACKVFASSYHRKVSMVAMVVQTPIRSFSGRHLSSCKTRSGTLEKAVSESGGFCYDQVLTDMVATLCDSTRIGWIGFSVDPDEHPAIVQEDCAIAARLFWEIVGEVGSLLTTLPMRSDNMPGMFCALLSSDPQVVMSTLARLKNLWGRQAYEQNADKPGVGSTVQSLMWPAMPWCREVLAELAESSWQGVPQRLRNALQEFAVGWSNTQVWHDLKDKQRRVDTAGKLSCRKSWYYAATGGLLADWDRKLVEINSEHRSAASGVHFVESMFKPRVGDATLPPEVWKTLTDPAWTSPGYDSLCLSFLATMAMEGIGTDWVKHANSWQSQLLVRSSLVNQANAPGIFLILEVFSFGAIAWRARLVQTGGIMQISLDPKGPARPWCFIQVFDFHLWKATAIEPLPPCVVAKHAPDLAAKPGGLQKVVLRSKGKPVSLLAFVGKAAFPNMTVPQLSKLATELQVEQPQRPEAKLLTQLIKLAVPAMDDTSIKAAIEARGHKAGVADSPGSSLLADDGVFDLVEGCLDEEDRDQVKEVVTKLRKARADASAKRASQPSVQATPAASASSLAGAGPQAASSSAPQQAPRQEDQPGFIPFRERQPIPMDIDVASAQVLKPTQGCTLAAERKRYGRWVATYPRLQLPRCKTKIWNMPGWNERRPLLYVCAFLWRCHLEENPGASCPYDFEEFSEMVS